MVKFCLDSPGSIESVFLESDQVCCCFVDSTVLCKVLCNKFPQHLFLQQSLCSLPLHQGDSISVILEILNLFVQGWQLSPYPNGYCTISSCDKTLFSCCFIEFISYIDSLCIVYKSHASFVSGSFCYESALSDLLRLYKHSGPYYCGMESLSDHWYLLFFRWVYRTVIVSPVLRSQLHLLQEQDNHTDLLIVYSPVPLHYLRLQLQ